MKYQSFAGNNRGMSEILGTVLVFSLVVLIAFVLAGVGFQLLDDATDESGDRMAQDAMREVDDRLASISGTVVGTRTEIEIPRAGGDEIETLPGEGRVNVTVATDDDGGNLTAADIVADEMAGSVEYPLGTLRHESTEGVESVYQGGMLFEREDNVTRIVSEPGFDWNGRYLDFSFTDLSEIRDVGGGDELLTKRDVEASQNRSEEIMTLIHRQRAIGDDPADPIEYASIQVNVTIETAYPEVWKTYAETRMTEEPRAVSVDEGEVTFEFGKLPGTYGDLSEFGDNVLYSGFDGTAHLFYNETLGEIEEIAAGFRVTGIDGGNSVQLHQDAYGLAVADEGIWKIANYDQTGPGPDLEWVNVSGHPVSEPDQFDAAASKVGKGGGGGASEDEWVWKEQAAVCLVVPDGPGPGKIETEDTRQIVAEENCQEATVGPEEEDLPEQEPIYELTLEDFDEEVETTDVAEFDLTVENVGDAYDEQYVYLGADIGDEGLKLVDYERLALYPGEEAQTTLSFPVGPSFNGDVVVSPENESRAITEELTLLDRPNFGIDWLDSGDTAAGGETVEVTAKVTNDGAKEKQLVTLQDPGGDVVDTEWVELGTDESRQVPLRWAVPLDADLNEAATLTVETPDDTATIDIDRTPEALVTDVNVTVDNEAEEVSVEATVENPGTDPLEDVEVRIDDGGTELLQRPLAPKSIDTLEDSATVAFDWELDDDALTDWVRVRTDDDSGEDLGVVERGGPDCGEVSFDGGDGSSDDPYRISNVDQLQCIENDFDADYELVDDIAAHGTEHWNGGDGFEPVGDQARHAAHFEGDFDGQGHRIEGLTIDRFDEPFVGLFAITHDFENTGVGVGVTIQDLELVDIEVRGKTVVGGLVGGAGGSIERISVDGDIESRYQQVGGIAGHGHDADLNNELVSHATVKGTYPAAIDGEHPWVNNNLGIGGIVGGTGFNTDVATAYSTATVTGNSAVGGITGWTSDYDSTNEQMYWVDGHVELDGDRRLNEDPVNRANLDPDPSAGAIAGRMELDSDNFADSVYSDENYRSIGEQKADADDIPRAPENMTGPQVLPDDRDESFYDDYPGVTKADAEGTMANLDWDIWTPVYDVDEEGNIVNEGFPIFQWQVEGNVLVTIEDAADTMTPGEDDLTVGVSVENTADERQEQTITLRTPDGTVVDSERVDLDAGEKRDITLTWETSFRDEVDESVDGEIVVSSEDTRDTESVTLEPVDGESVEIERVVADDSVEAIHGQFVVEVEVSADNTTLDDETLTLRANGALVDIDEDLGGDTEVTTLTWEPLFADIGSADLEVQVLGRDERATERVTVLSPAQPFEAGEQPPINVGFDCIEVES